MDILEQISHYQSSVYDWKERLQATEQEKAYHGEGNVWNHTRLVIESLLDSADYKALDKNAQKILLLAAVLHDIAKPFCTRIEHGIVVSPNHAVKGELEARRLIYKYGFMEELLGRFSFAEREAVCALIRYHGLPLLFMEKRDIQEAIFKASLEIRLEYVYILAKADMLGRYTADITNNLDAIEFFKEYCMENECFYSPRQFQNPSAKLMYFKRSGEYLYYAPYEADKTRVYMMSGIPASGKDTYIENNLNGIPMVSLDAIRVEMGVDASDNQGIIAQEAKGRARKLLAKKESFVWNATNTTGKRRLPLIDLFLEYNAFVEIIYTETAYHELLKRNSHREQYVPENIISKLTDRLEVPKLWESQTVTYFTEQ